LSSQLEFHRFDFVEGKRSAAPDSIPSERVVAEAKGHRSDVVTIAAGRDSFLLFFHKLDEPNPVELNDDGLASAASFSTKGHIR
jgi:hypothetical protein